MKTLYEKLGVKSKASSDQIQKKFRLLSRKHHPDRGGDPEKFREINDAYAVLSDLERRRRYDETGDTNPIVDHSVRLMITVLTESFADIMKALVAQNANAKSNDVVESMRLAIQKSMSDLKVEIARVGKLVDHSEASLERISDQECGFLKGVARAKAAEYSRMHEGLQDAHKAHVAALEYLKECGYMFEKMIRGSSWTSATTAASWSS